MGLLRKEKEQDEYQKENLKECLGVRKETETEEMLIHQVTEVLEEVLDIYIQFRRFSHTICHNHLVCHILDCGK